MFTIFTVLVWRVSMQIVANLHLTQSTAETNENVMDFADI